MKDFGAALRQQFPDAAYDVKRAIAEGDLVLLHSNSVLAPGTPGSPSSTSSASRTGRSPSTGTSSRRCRRPPPTATTCSPPSAEPQTEAPGQRWLTAYNKKLVTAFVDQLLVRKDLAAIDTYVGTEYHQHSPNIPDGVAGVKAGLGANFERFPQLSVTPKRVIAEGDLVAVHSHYINTPGERGRAVVDLFRVRDGKIVEHWDACRTCRRPPPTTTRCSDGDGVVATGDDPDPCSQHDPHPPVRRVDGSTLQHFRKRRHMTNLEIEDRGAVLIVRIDGGPHQLFGREMAQQLYELVDRVDDDPNVRAVVFTGAYPDRFIGGADVQWLQEEGDASPSLGRRSGLLRDASRRPVDTELRALLVGRGGELLVLPT